MRFLIKLPVLAVLTILLLPRWIAALFVAAPILPVGLMGYFILDSLPKHVFKQQEKHQDIPAPVLLTARAMYWAGLKLDALVHRAEYTVKLLYGFCPEWPPDRLLPSRRPQAHRQPKRTLPTMPDSKTFAAARVRNSDRETVLGVLKEDFPSASIAAYHDPAFLTVALPSRDTGKLPHLRTRLKYHGLLDR